MTVRELIELLRIHTPDTEVAIGRRNGVTRPVGRTGIEWRVERGIVGLMQLSDQEATTAVPVVCLWPE